jgi:lysophospholipase L1-like esterase
VITSPRRRSRAALAAPAAVLALLLAGCAGTSDAPSTTSSTGSSGATNSPSDDPGADLSPSPSEDPTDPLPAPDVDIERYVALGDSYTSAPFVPETETETGCLRSSGNYPNLVAEAIDPEEFADVSCAGADATSLVGAQRTSEGFVPPQFDAVTEDTDLVTIGLGGNDFGVFSRLIAGCVARADQNPDGAPCRSAQQVGGQDRLLADLAKTRQRLASVVSGVRDRVGQDARVLLVGYPLLVPEEGTCPERLPLAEGDYPYVRRVNRALNDAIRSAARASGATYVDVGAASVGHSICSEDPWVNGVDTDEDRALAYHPFAAGQRAVADLVLQALTEPRSATA